MVEVFNTAIKYHSRTHINSNKLICSLSLNLRSSCFISISGGVQASKSILDRSAMCLIGLTTKPTNEWWNW